MNFSNKLSVIILFFVFFIQLTKAETETHKTLRALVSSATSQAELFGCQDASMIIDHWHILQQKKEFKSLETALSDSWEIVISDFDEVAINDMEKIIILCSCWQLTNAEFIRLLSKVADLVEQKKLNKELFRWCQNPLDGKLHGFLVKNHEDTAVQCIIRRSRLIFRDNERLVAGYDEMLTGDSRRKLEQFMLSTQADIAVLKTEPHRISNKELLLRQQYNHRDEDVKSTGEKRGKLNWVAIVLLITVSIVCVGVWKYARHE